MPAQPKRQLRIDLPKVTDPYGRPAFSMDNWNAQVPERLRLRCKHSIQNDMGTGMDLVKICRINDITASWGSSDDGRMLYIYITLPPEPGRWQARPLGRKLSALFQ